MQTALPFLIRLPVNLNTPNKKLRFQAGPVTGSWLTVSLRW